MSKSIRLSPKHGVNPMLMQCFFCGGDAGIALLGRLPDDAEAPRRACVDTEPCAECKAKMKLGVMFIEVEDVPGVEGNALDAHAMPKRTGRMWVIKDEAVRRIVLPVYFAERVLKARFVFVHQNVLPMLGLPYETTQDTAAQDDQTQG